MRCIHWLFSHGYKNMKKLILASKSPRRQELLRSAGYSFTVIPATGEEIIPADTPPEQVAVLLATQKADEVFSNTVACNTVACNAVTCNAVTTVIAADTIVVIDDNILGKPRDAAEAFTMLKSLSGRQHCVITGVAVYDGNSKHSFYEKAVVEFHDLTDEEIDAYIKTGEPFDKAGGYGIQGKGMLLVKSINGDFYNVMGLPVSRVSRLLSELGHTTEKKHNINDLLAIMARLRVDCPWDKEQTHSSIRANVIEEAYEVAQAIDQRASDNPGTPENQSTDELCEELGDLLLQVVFHAQIASESQDFHSFNFDDVCDGICNKLIYRHPHVFSDVNADSTAEVLKNWDNLKSKSKGEQTAAERLNSVPHSLPALMRAEKVAKRALASGALNISNQAMALDNLKNGIDKLEKLINQNLTNSDTLCNIYKECDKTENVFGDILLSCCILGIFFEKDFEKLLTLSTNQFIMHFGRLEQIILESGRETLEGLTSNQLDELWKKINDVV